MHPEIISSGEGRRAAFPALCGRNGSRELRPRSMPKAQRRTHTSAAAKTFSHALFFVYNNFCLLSVIFVFICYFLLSFAGIFMDFWMILVLCIFWMIFFEFGDFEAFLLNFCWNFNGFLNDFGFIYCFECAFFLFWCFEWIFWMWRLWIFDFWMYFWMISFFEWELCIISVF